MTGHVVIVERLMHADLQDVWDVLTDVEHQADWLHSVSDVVPLTDGDFTVGTRWRDDRIVIGHHGIEDVRVVECRSPLHTATRTVVGKDVVTTTYSLTPGDAGTHVTATLVADTEGRSLLGQLGWNIWGAWSFRKTRKSMEQDLKDIETYVHRKARAAR
jgi:uncharacterized protein YndB with AHSA1/START domain